MCVCVCVCVCERKKGLKYTSCRKCANTTQLGQPRPLIKSSRTVTTRNSNCYVKLKTQVQNVFQIEGGMVGQIEGTFTKTNSASFD